MKKLISLVIAVALVVCLLPVMASAAATELHLDCPDHTGYLGGNLYLNAYDENGANFPDIITWESSNPAVANISSGYMNEVYINLVGVGTATITATCGGLTDTCDITVKAPEVVTLDTPLQISLNGANPNVAAVFTPAEAGTYTIYIPETTGNVGGYATNANAYGDFATSAGGEITAAAVTLAAGETCYIFVYPYGDMIDCTLAVVETPALESCKLNAEAYELVYVGNAFSSEGYASLAVTPVTAAAPEGMYWKIKDETVATLYYSMNNYCYFGALKPGETVLEVYDGNDQLITSAPLIVKNAADVAQPLYWGVEYEIDTTVPQVYTFTPSVTDDYTFESTGGIANADPCVDIFVKDQGEWKNVNHFDDYEGLDFNGTLQLEKDAEYLIMVRTLNEFADYGFTMKGTDASDPGYDLEKVAAVPATCTEDGNIEYYKCKTTGLLFANAEGTKLAGDVVVKAAGHKLEKVEATKTTIAHEKCSVCEALFVDGKEVTSIDNPKTGDNTMLLPLAALVVLSITGLAVTVVAKKKAY